MIYQKFIITPVLFDHVRGNFLAYASLSNKQFEEEVVKGKYPIHHVANTLMRACVESEWTPDETTAFYVRKVEQALRGSNDPEIDRELLKNFFSLMPPWYKANESDYFDSLKQDT